MIKSMTGFASLTRDDERGTLTVTVRSVNHRFLDLQLRLPPLVAELEPRLRALLQRRLTRGRVEVSISLHLRQPSTPHVELDEEFVRALNDALERARSKSLVVGHLTPGDLLRVPQAMVIRERVVDPTNTVDAWADAFEAALDRAIDQLDEMRVREGAHLAADLEARRGALVDLMSQAATAAERGAEALRARLMERVTDLQLAVPLDPAAIVQEVVRVAQRSDITEELTRFRGHLAHWLTLAVGPEPCGRKLDFLLQELNREVNTIGAKADGLEVSERIIQAKVELERVREQVQNVE